MLFGSPSQINATCAKSRNQRYEYLFGIHPNQRSMRLVEYALVFYMMLRVSSLNPTYDNIKSLTDGDKMRQKYGKLNNPDKVVLYWLR